MALTRRALKAMGLTDEQVESIIDMHTETVNGLKADVAKYRADAEKLPNVQKELDELKTSGDGGYKAKYDAEHAAFEAYKTEQTNKETRAAKEKAVRAYYESKGIKGNNLEVAMRGSASEIEALELDGEKIKDAACLDTLIGGTFSGLVSNKPTFDWSASLGGDNGKPNTNETMNALIRGAFK